ncbi:MAG: cation-translocating P-type ATPase [Clostridia bacterium]|nr:cation-translocating P-type ATPase [Clostridia bacterium]
MENIDNIAKKSLEALAKDNLNEKNKRSLTVNLLSAAASLVCIAVGLIYSWVFPDKTTVPALLYTVGFLIEGIPVFVAALKGIFSRNFTNAMEILVAIAILACYLSGDLILSVLIPLILNIAHLLEERSIMGGREAIDGLKRMRQDTAVLLDGEEEKTVEASSLEVGQIIVVKPGSGIPIDGKVISGETNVDQKSLTGEPLPAHIKVGDKVYAGTVNIDGRILVEVEKAYVDTSFSNILTMLEEAENISIPESRLIDRFMRYYIPFVLALAAAVALITNDLSKAIAILVVSCPCGQMLVSSAPMIASLSTATKRGILIKNSKFIEEMTEVETVVFDKTGTLTVGELSLTDILSAEGYDDDTLLSLAASLACGSNHPVSRAVTEAIEGKDYETLGEVKEIPGKGMQGKDAEGNELILGNKYWFDSLGISIPEGFGDDFTGSVSFVARGGVLIGCLGFNDTARTEASESITSLKDMGIKNTVILTGDREIAARKIASEVGADDVRFQLLPQDKLEAINELRESSCVLAVGDGINDAPALRQADVGIAMGAMGSDLAIQSADIALMNNNLENIPFIIKLSKQTRRIIYQNLILSVLISLTMIGLSLFGVISALFGAVFHNVGAFVVLINSSRILKTK